jgi:hypothetical protein
MEWSPYRFLAFLALGTVGAIVGFVFLLALRRNLESNLHRLPTLAFLSLLSIFLAGIAAGAISLTPWLLGPQTLGSPTESIFTQFSYVFAFISMLFGMAASYFNKLITERRSKIEALRKNGNFTKPTIEFDVWDFVQPFFASIITFGAVVARTKDVDLWTTLLVGFQTGFFWQTILSYQASASASQVSASTSTK